MTFFDEVKRRRTFAIISHPDAGKTTLTEKFLMYGGAVQLAGTVTARNNHRATTSDWMDLEKQRGISVSSTVLQFDYDSYCVNLLDTPGHHDFSEDTYRVLTAVDAAVMVIDAGKGIEAQTRKLFEVCRRRGVPIFTFMNKLDRPARDPLDLLDELEKVLGIQAYAVNWPLGAGDQFKGVYDRIRGEVHLFERTVQGAYRAPVVIGDLSSPAMSSQLSERVFAQVQEELEMLDAAGADFDLERIHSGQLTPVFFGSAMNNFGVQLLLDNFLALSLPPGPRPSTQEEIVPEAPFFSGFVFKIQANLDPRHRDRIAFVRIVSGKFQRDMMVHHSRTGKMVRLSNAQKLFGRERETLDEAYAGDVIGLVGKDDFGIGDTLTENSAVVFHEIPRFSPEIFAYLHNANNAKYKRFNDGFKQLLQEGVVQTFEVDSAVRKGALLGAVGPLQFEVVQYRLESEYGAESTLEPTGFVAARWIRAKDSSQTQTTPVMTMDTVLARDSDQNLVVLFQTQWALRSFGERNAGFEISDVPFAGSSEASPSRKRTAEAVVSG
ncbi:peptide chain release factor 3 [Abditibacteriota bacterium]|nr:peptide chain release factor 3 [Abditibacteriota bacterium]